MYFKLLLVILLAGGVFVSAEDLDPFADLSGHATDESKELLSFDNTQKWAPKYLAHTVKKPLYLPANWRSKIAAALPPKNSSLRTQAEIARLLELQKTRTPEDIERIKKEIKLVGFQFDDLSYPEIVDIKKRPKTAALAKAANGDIVIVMFQAKQYFNRVRPHALDPRIKPAIKVPDHASYPSGHSTQAYMWAYLLCELTPTEKHAAILAGAKLIAQDRELAGVHYQSDTALGKRIARQVVDMWMANAKFRALLNAAKSEW